MSVVGLLFSVSTSGRHRANRNLTPALHSCNLSNVKKGAWVRLSSFSDDRLVGSHRVAPPVRRESMVSPGRVLTRPHLRVKAFLAQLILVRRGLCARTMIGRQHQPTRCALLLGAGPFHTGGLIELSVASVVDDLQLQDIRAGDGRQGGA